MSMQVFDWCADTDVERHVPLHGREGWRCQPPSTIKAFFDGATSVLSLEVQPIFAPPVSTRTIWVTIGGDWASVGRDLRVSCNRVSAADRHIFGGPVSMDLDYSPPDEFMARGGGIPQDGIERSSANRT